MEKSNIYTATGDTGTTSLVGGKRVKKNDIRLEAYGTVDELNSWLGMLNANQAMRVETKTQLHRIQNRLFNIGAYLATDNEGKETAIQGLTSDDISTIEHNIDQKDSALPKLNRFVLPGGSNVASVAHICRTVTRRCERRVISLGEITYIDPIVIKYLNRLSDYFFILARELNNNSNIEEIFWDKD
ncbi:MAG: cob(I)yrinic acid a,c-diamide adenosyltransferase [Muribaculaceae bacterium]|nr:cob(I)yrinic acid a,c-diamide adenosyltransferase [Muribaculaceae bacterium]